MNLKLKAKLSSRLCQFLHKPLSAEVINQMTQEISDEIGNDIIERIKKEAELAEEFNRIGEKENV